MPDHLPSRDADVSADTISRDMFGANFVTVYDDEFDDFENLLRLLDTLGVETLRYPGGSITESAFTENVFLTGDWDLESYVDHRGIERELTPLSSFMRVAGEVEASAQLVIPTRVAFALSMEQALANGRYGARTRIDSAYFDRVAAYVEAALAAAEAQGVEIARFELGNEFWGSGKMTAGEYGYLAARLAVFLSELHPGVEIIAQAASSANVYSPLSSRDVLLEPDGAGDYILHEVPAGTSPQADWLRATIPGNGNGREQTETIAGHFAALPGATTALTGIVEHLYFDGGFEDIDREKSFALGSIPAAFAARIGRRDLTYHITEWSARNPGWSEDSENLGNANGLQYAQTTVEAFFELTSHGVDAANFWPVTFGSPSVIHRTLIDSVEADLTFGGQTFQWMSSDLPGLQPAFDYDVEGQIDIHGFENSEKMVLFVGERSGVHQAGIRIDLSEMLAETRYFALFEQMSSSSHDPLDDTGNVVLSSSGGYMLDQPVVTFDAEAWSLSKIRLQMVSDAGDHLEGGSAADRIEGEGGADFIAGGAGADTLKGQLGDDTLQGGDGSDVLIAGWGEDRLAGGGGDDRLYGGGGDDILSGGPGADLLSGDTGDDLLDGAQGDDELLAGDGHDWVRAGDGNDLIEITATSVQSADAFAWNVGAFGGVGTGQILPLVGKNVSTAVIHGGHGWDTLTFGDGADALFLHDEVSDMHHALGEALRARFASIESIVTGGGDDLVDLTSQEFSLAGAEIEIDAGNGDDVIWGSDANELIRGGSGSDTIFGGTGRDTLEGGDGADIFEFTSTSTACTIADFTPEEGDMLRFCNQADTLFDPASMNFSGDALSIATYDWAGRPDAVVTISFENANSDGFSYLTFEIVQFMW